MFLLPKNETMKAPAQLMVSVENYIASVKISDLYQWMRNTPHGTQSVKTPNRALFCRGATQSVVFGDVRCFI